MPRARKSELDSFVVSGIECGVPDEIRSPTQRELSITDIAAIVRDAIGAEVDRGEELTGGGFATVWWAVLADGRQVAVKVGPAAGARLLAYEKGLLIAEAEYFRLVGDRAPVPTVLFESDDVLISTMLPGRALTEIPAEQAAPIRTELGRAVARIHEVTGTRFGYTGGRVSEATCRSPASPCRPPRSPRSPRRTWSTSTCGTATSSLPGEG
jgi:hypothetical protein